MKKLALTIAIVLGLGLSSFAQGGLFQRGADPDQENGFMGNRSNTPTMPNHNLTGNQDDGVPVGSGIAVLAVLGGAYLVGKKRREE